MSKKKYVDKVYRLTRGHAPLSLMIPARSTRRTPLLYFDEEKGENRELRYAKNQRSVFVDEQDGNILMEAIVFEDGFLSVPKNNQVLQKFLELHPLNGRKFEEVDTEREARQEMEDLNLEVDALIEARNLTVSQMETVGRILFDEDVSLVTTAELKRDILIFARKYPDTFLNAVNDPDLKLNSKVKLFFDKGLLSFRPKKREIYFSLASNRKKMASVPFGEDHVSFLSAYFQSDEGIDTLKYLENNLDE